MKIRKARIEDLEEIAKVENLCFPINEAASKEALKQRLEVYADHFWLLFEREQLVSFIDGMVTSDKDLKDEMYENAHLHDPQGSWQMIFGVNTIPTYQHQGYASCLMRQVIEDVKKEGRLGIVLTCKDRLISFYEQFGFVNEGISESVHGDVIWYQMRLVYPQVETLV